mgnify:CR=1 FL=1
MFFAAGAEGIDWYQIWTMVKAPDNVPIVLLLSVTFWVFKADSVRRAPIGFALEVSTPAEADAAISAMEIGRAHV